MTEYHESGESLSEETKNFHRALISLQEEIEAVDWYHQRVSVCQDESLRSVLAHNRDEEIEHACMALEWIRRTMPHWDENLRKYLFTEDLITGIEEAGKGNSDSRAGDLGIGHLRKEAK